MVKNDRILIELQSPYEPNDSLGMSAHISKHGDGVRDVAFTVDDAAAIYNKAISRGAKSVRAPETLSDEHGSMIIASI